MAVDVAAGAIGAGLGTATIWLPITYFAARNGLNLRRDLGRAWLPFVCSVLAFAGLHVVGVFPSTETSSGLLGFFVLPPTVCALILFITFRSTTAPPINPFACSSERARVGSLFVAAVAFCSWLLWVAVSSDGFATMKPLGWVLVVGAPAVVFAAARFAVTRTLHSKHLRLLLAGSVLWLFAVAAWGFIAEWEAHLDTQRYAALFVLPPLGVWLGYLLWRWATSGR